MKRIYSFMFAAVATFAAASCTQELDNQVPAGETVTFEASVDGAETKAVLDGKVSKWEKGDKITIHNGTKGFEFATTDEGVKANFSYTGNDFAGDKFIAVYPAGNYTADVEAKTVKAYIPTFQGAREGTYNENAILSVAYTENNSLAFKNACALLKFTVKGEKSIKAIEFYGNNSEAVTGNMLVTLNEDNTVKSVEGLETTFQEGDNTWNGMGTWVKFYSEDKANDWCFKEGVTYYAAIAPANFTKGVALNLILADDTKVEAVKKTETPYDLKPNTILNIGELEYKAPAVENLNWGIAGTMTSWADGKDLAMVQEGDWLVAKNVTLNAGASFKFRTDGKWGTERGTDGTPVPAGVEVKLISQSAADIKAEVPAIYDIYMAKTADKMKLVKIGDVEAPAVSNWGIVGTLTSWSSNIAMAVEGDWYVAKNVTITTEDGFKFRNGDSWEDKDLLTYNAGKAEDGVEYLLTGGAGENNEIKVAASAVYDVYLALNLNKFKVVKVGDVEVEEPSDEPVASDWGVIGDLTGWGDTGKDITMYSYKGMYVAYNVKFTAAGSFKIRKGGAWNDATNYGLETSGDVEPGYYYKVIASGGSGNIKVKAGTYDIWFDLNNKRVYVLNPGTDPATVSEGKPSAPSNWNLVGSFNGWNPGDKTYAMTAQGDYYVYKGFTCTSTVEMKFAPGSWGGDKGATSSSNVVKDKKYSTGGTNIKVPAGTYDIYLKKDLKNYWFMTPGSVPAN